MVEVCALASGSNGNCYYIGNETEAILANNTSKTVTLNKKFLDLKY
jgi:hypothetical protein